MRFRTFYSHRFIVALAPPCCSLLSEPTLRGTWGKPVRHPENHHAAGRLCGSERFILTVLLWLSHLPVAHYSRNQLFGVRGVNQSGILKTITPPDGYAVQNVLFSPFYCGSD